MLSYCWHGWHWCCRIVGMADIDAVVLLGGLTLMLSYCWDGWHWYCRIVGWIAHCPNLGLKMDLKVTWAPVTSSSGHSRGPQKTLKLVQVAPFIPFQEHLTAYSGFTRQRKWHRERCRKGVHLGSVAVCVAENECQLSAIQQSAADAACTGFFQATYGRRPIRA